MAKAMSTLEIDLLEKRIEDVEKRIFGESDKDAVYPKDAPEIIDNLASLNGQLQAATASRPKIDSVLKRLGEFEKYLDPAYTERLTMSKNAKIEIILAEEELIHQHAANLDKVKNMCDVLGSEHIKDPLTVVPSLENKLQELSKAHIKQQDETSELTEEMKELLQQYNNAVTLLSKQFVQWDETITRLEVASQPKKQLE